MSYQAKVIKVQTIVPMPNADRLELIKYGGYQFVVGKGEFQVGDVAILFPTDGQLSIDFCKNNNLFSDSSLNKDTTKKGYFSDNRRVKAQQFRGEKSEGFICSPFSFSYLGGSISFDEDQEFDTLKGELVCEKYYTPQTKRKMANQNSQGIKKHRDTVYSLREHPDTPQLAYNYDKLPESGMVIISEKAHGTSQRTGNVLVTRNKNHLYDMYLLIKHLTDRMFHDILYK